jgi:hypothetical protein
MTYTEYPKTDKEALAYAQQIAENKGEKRHAIRLAPNNPFGVTHAVCGGDDLADYLANGCTLIEA